MVWACAALGATGFTYTLGLLYATTDVDAAIASSNAAIEVYVASCGVGIGTIMAYLLIATVFLSGEAA